MKNQVHNWNQSKKFLDTRLLLENEIIPVEVYLKANKCKHKKGTKEKQ